MLEILERMELKDKFLEIKFEQIPFQLEGDNKENLSSIFDNIIDSLEGNDSENKNEFRKYIKEYDNIEIKLEYKKQSYNIYRNPIIFQLYYEPTPSFKVYDRVQLENVLSELQQYYYFIIEQDYYNSLDIMKLKDENKLQNNIKLYPFIINIFNILCQPIDFNDLKKYSSFYINKERLEPFFLYIEKMEIIKKIGYENLLNFNKDLLKQDLIYILNKERINFINDLDEYAKITIQREPLIIIGNDGVGKTLTLQLYSLIKLDGFKKVYFNLKLFNKINPRNYFLIELMKGFISRDKDEHKEDFKRYINFLKRFQDSDFSSMKKIFQILNEIMIYLKFTGKYIIILDQFDFEKIDMTDFYNFKNKIPNEFKLIICSSLNDDKNKSNLFSDYKDIDIYQFLPEFQNTISEKNNNEIIPNIKNKEDIQIKGTSVKNFFLIKKRKREKDITNIEEKSEKQNNINEKIKLEMTNEKEKLDMNKSSVKNEKKEKKAKIFSLEEKQINYFDLILPINYQKIDVNFCDKKQKIYFGSLVYIEDVIRYQDEPNDIINCMSEFNFIPKYYYKFNLFKNVKILEGKNNIDDIIKSFYEEEYNNIKNNITIFYSKMNLNQNKIEIKNNNVNIYQNLIKLKKSIAKTYENSINFPKLYKYSKIFPFKYINIQIENEKTDIKFDEELKFKKFRLKYSFPFIETVIDKMIKTYDNENKININELSCSAHGNALELKIRENLNKFEQVIEVRKVWSLDSISDKVKTEKLKEIDNEKKFKKTSRFEYLEDINGIKELKAKFYYFKPENQVNKLFDSLFLIKNDENDFHMCSLQITKNRDKRNVKTKEEYSKFLINNIKLKFENLYKIKVSKIYFWFILGFENLENVSLCSILNKMKIKYSFYSIKDKCFFKNRDDKKLKINNIKEFMDEESQIFPSDENDINNNIIIKSNPMFIDLFDDKLCKDFENNNEIFFENTRNIYFPDDSGPIIGDDLRNNISLKLKDYIIYSNEFKILFLFSFPAETFLEFKKYKEKNELIYLFKVKNKIYILFKDKCFEIKTQKKFIEGMCITENFVRIKRRKKISQK